MIDVGTYKAKDLRVTLTQERLQRVLFYRELGFPLEQIVVLLDDPAIDAQEHLRRQHDLLIKRIERLYEMATAVERAMEAEKMGISLTPEERHAFPRWREHRRPPGHNLLDEADQSAGEPKQPVK